MLSRVCEQYIISYFSHLSKKLDRIPKPNNLGNSRSLDSWQRQDNVLHKEGTFTLGQSCAVDSMYRFHMFPQLAESSPAFRARLSLSLIYPFLSIAMD